jgi:23S rRNA (adenine2503-C2)-methyltransferase
MSGKRITNVVFMGMGEPLMNYHNLLKAVEILGTGLGIALRRMTVSTAGWAEKIRKLGDEQRRVKLAVSLHSANDDTRTRLMPINKKFNLASLLSALQYYYARTKQRVTYEVIFFDGINDSMKDVADLTAFANKVPCKINVIPFHSIDFTSPRGFAADLKQSPRMEEIVEELRLRGLTVFVRSNSGDDIDAACGQLALKLEHGLGLIPGRPRARHSPARVGA